MESKKRKKNKTHPKNYLPTFEGPIFFYSLVTCFPYKNMNSRLLLN